MAPDERLERLIADEVGECRTGDVETRRGELDTLAGTVPDRVAADASVMATLGDETRYRITRLLAAAEGELCVCELTPLVDVSESAVSHALADLTEVGLATRRKDGTWRYYDATERAERVLEALDATREVPA